MNTYKLENIKLKTKIQQFEKEIDKKDKLMRNILEQMSTDQAPSKVYGKRIDADTSAIMTLKRQVKELKDEANERNEDLKSLEANLKGAKNDEMELQLKQQIGECSKIREAIEEAIRDAKEGRSAKNIEQIEERLHQQSIMLSNMRKENEQLMITLKRKQKDVEEIQESAAALDEKNKKYSRDHKEHARNRKTVKDVKKELDAVKKQISLLQVDAKDKGVDVYQARIQELIQQQRNLEGKINEKEEKISSFSAKARGDAGAEGKISESSVKEMRAKVVQCKEGAVI